MDASQWRQDVGLLSPVDGRTNGPAHNPTCQKPATPSLSLNSDSKRAADLTIHSKQQQKDQSVDCPRCKSSNTKFCYYNNYSLTQPRYFCKSCRRYWTQGGTLRNVPVGGSSRKNFSKRSSSKLVLGMNPNPLSHLASHDPMTPSKIMMPDHQGHDLNTALYFGNSQFQELAPSGAVDKGLGLGSYMPEYPSGFSVLELKPNPGFYMDAHAGYGSNGYKQIGIESSNNTAPEWFFFPHQLGEFSKLAAAPANGTAAIDGHHRAQSQQEHHKNRESDRDQQSSGYWNHGMY